MSPGGCSVLLGWQPQGGVPEALPASGASPRGSGSKRSPSAVCPNALLLSHHTLQMKLRPRRSNLPRSHRPSVPRLQPIQLWKVQLIWAEECGQQEGHMALGRATCCHLGLGIFCMSAGHMHCS